MVSHGTHEHNHSGQHSGHNSGDVVGSAVAKIFNELSTEDEGAVLGMLHVPLIHGGTSEVLLFPWATTGTPGSFAIACIVLAICAALLELARLFVWWIEQNGSPTGGTCESSSCKCKEHNGFPSSSLTLTEHGKYNSVTVGPGDVGSSTPLKSTARIPTRWWVCLGGSGVLQFIVYFIATLLMLISMTMNIYIILSLAAGSAIGKMSVLYIRRKYFSKYKM